MGDIDNSVFHYPLYPAVDYYLGKDMILSPKEMQDLDTILARLRNFEPQSAPAFRNRQCGTDWQLLAQSNSPAKHGDMGNGNSHNIRHFGLQK
jgi:hypothetical protein